jgi:HNH endonuclease
MKQYSPQCLNSFIDGGKKTQFAKGQPAWNKGLKHADYMSDDGLLKIAKTRFQKGNKNWKERHDGAIQIKISKGIPYQFIRISLNNWIPLHRKIWIDANGELPKGKFVVFKDKNTMNCELSNLEIIDRAESMRRNTIHNYSPEIKESIYLIKKLKRKVNEKQTK